MNKILKKQDEFHFQKYYHILQTGNECSWQNSPDALLKWSSILSAVETLKFEPKKLADFGCGQSNLSFAIDSLLNHRLDRIYLLDFEAPASSFLSNQKFMHLRGDAILTSSIIEDECLDLVVDSCSVIHFRPSFDFSANDGIREVAKIMKRVLKPGGYFISSSDILSFDGDEIRGEFISARCFIDIFENEGLKIVNEFDFSYDDAFLLGEISHGHGRQLAIGNFVFVKEKYEHLRF